MGLDMFRRKNDKLALEEFKNGVLRQFPEARFILFGSKARGEEVKFSDRDVLVVLRRDIVTDIEKSIFGVGFETGLRFGVIFGIVVEQESFFDSALAKAMPFYQNIAKEGAQL